MKWILKEAKQGDMVRVKLGEIYHYGIFASEEEVIQFGLAPTLRQAVEPSDIEVCCSDIDTFLAGGFLEVAEYDWREKIKNRSPKETLAYARSKIGMKGYHILYYNCEHFAYECLTGKKYCSQTDDVRAFFKSMPVVDVYLARIPEEIQIETVIPSERNDYIQGVTNEKVKAERYYVWKLLEYGLERSLGLRMEKLHFQKTENGKWTNDRCEISLSHCDGAVAVAVSRAAIGIDIETMRQMNPERIAEKILTKQEKKLFAQVDGKDSDQFLLEKWTEKEALFKKTGEKTFLPQEYDTCTEKVYAASIELKGVQYQFSVATDTPEKVRLYTNLELK